MPTALFLHLLWKHAVPIIVIAPLSFMLLTVKRCGHQKPLEERPDVLLSFTSRQDDDPYIRRLTITQNGEAHYVRYDGVEIESRYKLLSADEINGVLVAIARAGLPSSGKRYDISRQWTFGSQHIHLVIRGRRASGQSAHPQRALAESPEYLLAYLEALTESLPLDGRDGVFVLVKQVTPTQVKELEAGGRTFIPVLDAELRRYPWLREAFEHVNRPIFIAAAESQRLFRFLDQHRFVKAQNNYYGIVLLRRR